MCYTNKNAYNISQLNIKSFDEHVKHFASRFTKTELKYYYKIFEKIGKRNQNHFSY